MRMVLITLEIKTTNSNLHPRGRVLTLIIDQDQEAPDQLRLQALEAAGVAGLVALVRLEYSTCKTMELKRF